jgi:hypothetical protein
MADNFELDAAKVRRSLESLARKFPNEVARALYSEAQIERTESMRRTPVDTGALRASHGVTDPSIGVGGDISVTIFAGGVAAPYAVKVHEDLSAMHRTGQAKFLESTLMESRPYLAGRIARRIQLERLL